MFFQSVSKASRGSKALQAARVLSADAITQVSGGLPVITLEEVLISSSSSSSSEGKTSIPPKK